jgi:hypothetical protein
MSKQKHRFELPEFHILEEDRAILHLKPNITDNQLYYSNYTINSDTISGSLIWV